MRETFSLSGKPPRQGPVGPLHVEPPDPPLAHGGEQVDTGEVRPQRPLHRPLGEVPPAHREHGRLHPRGTVRGVDHRAVQGERDGTGRIGDPDVPVQREGVEAGEQHPLQPLAVPAVPAASVARQAHVALTARGALQLRQQRGPLPLAQPEPGLPGAQFPRHPEPRPVQRPVVVAAEVPAGRPAALHPVHRAPPQRRALVRHHGTRLAVGVRAPEPPGERRCHRVESGAPQDLPGHVPVEPPLLHGRCGGGTARPRFRRRRGGGRESRHQGQSEYADPNTYGCQGSPGPSVAVGCAAGRRQYRVREGVRAMARDRPTRGRL
ncbi:hypothetical protein RKD37_006221 [Streptomyces ambofaciens]